MHTSFLAISCSCVIMSIRKNIFQRVVIHSKDVANITGCKDRTARHTLQSIKQALGKHKFQFVTVYEFCAITGIDEETVRNCMQE